MIKFIPKIQYSIFIKYLTWLSIRCIFDKISSRIVDLKSYQYIIAFLIKYKGGAIPPTRTNLVPCTHTDKKFMYIYM